MLTLIVSLRFDLVLSYPLSYGAKWVSTEKRTRWKERKKERTDGRTKNEEGGTDEEGGEGGGGGRRETNKRKSGEPIADLDIGEKSHREAQMSC